MEFFKRISKYLRSIGYYGDAPFMMCNYGSSEYSQAFSRVGSLYGNVYIVNEELSIQDLVKTHSASKEESKEGEDQGDKKEAVESIEINYNDLPITIPPGGAIIQGYHYRSILQNRLGLKDGQPKKPIQCLRTTLITKKPLLGHAQENNKLCTFTVPPQTIEQGGFGNVNPIRIYQQNHFIEACPRGSFLILMSLQLNNKD